MDIQRHCDSLIRAVEKEQDGGMKSGERQKLEKLEKLEEMDKDIPEIQKKMTAKRRKQ